MLSTFRIFSKIKLVAGEIFASSRAHAAYEVIHRFGEACGAHVRMFTYMFHAEVIQKGSEVDCNNKLLFQYLSRTVYPATW